MNTPNEIDIFIIDDNKIFSMALMAFIQNAFNDRKIKISVFETGEKCMEIFDNIKPELVVLD